MSLGRSSSSYVIRLLMTFHHNECRMKSLRNTLGSPLFRFLSPLVAYAIFRTLRFTKGAGALLGRKAQRQLQDMAHRLPPGLDCNPWGHSEVQTAPLLRGSLLMAECEVILHRVKAKGPYEGLRVDFGENKGPACCPLLACYGLNLWC